MKNRNLRTITVQIDEDMYKFLNSRLIGREKFCRAFSIKTVEDLVSQFFNPKKQGRYLTEDDRAGLKEDILSVEHDLEYISYKGFVREVEQGIVNTDPDDLRSVRDFIEEHEELHGVDLPDTFDEGWLKFFRGWRLAFELGVRSNVSDADLIKDHG